MSFKVFNSDPACIVFIVFFFSQFKLRSDYLLSKVVVA